MTEASGCQGALPTTPSRYGVPCSKPSTHSVQSILTVHLTRPKYIRAEHRGLFVGHEPHPLSFIPAGIGADLATNAHQLSIPWEPDDGHARRQRHKQKKASCQHNH